MAEKEKKGGDEKQNIIIKRVKKVSAGHHGGAWKVAYADFVTAMMAFFLLLWLLSVTTNEQKQKIADYFAPTDPRISQDESGSGGIMGGTTVSPKGAKTDDTVRNQNSPHGDDDDAQNSPDQSAAQNAASDKQDAKDFKDAAENLRQSIEAVPELKEYMPNLLIDMTPEGLRIQIIDTTNKPMFETGSATPLPPTIKLLSMITGVIKDLPNKVSVRGHTDSAPYGKDASYSNWELSSDRANASRRIIVAAGYNIVKIENVQGKADREPLDTKDPASPRNRRITLLILKQSIAPLGKPSPSTVAVPPKAAAPAAPELHKHEDGVIDFP
jgi:chemotaxis protein MotB